MSLLTGPALVAASLLALAGAQKLLDPEQTVGALRALRLPSSPGLVRAGSAAELGLGAAAVVIGSPPLWWLVAASYLAFTVVVVMALRAGTMIGSCGCFGKEETPPHWSHLALNLALATVAASTAVVRPAPLAEALLDDLAQAAIVVPLVALGLYLLYAAYVELPRTLAAGKPARSPG